MSRVPTVEAEELLTKRFLRSELSEALHRQTLLLAGALAGATALVVAVKAFV